MLESSPMFNLSSKSKQIVHLSGNDEVFRSIYKGVGDLSFELYSNPYEFLVFTIIGQMLSNKVADVICERFLKLCANNICPDIVNSISSDKMRELGMSYSKAAYIKNLTEAILSDELDLLSLKNKKDDEILADLTKIKGIGKWSAKMFLIFVLGREDVLPFEDGAFMKAYSIAYNEPKVELKKLKKRAEKWSPYSSIVARYFYKALDSGFLVQNPVWDIKS